MPYYSVSHPQLDISATVDAPTSEKARTTFLDYLERNGKIRRAQRQLLRKAMATKKLDEGSEGYSDLELHYEYEHVSEAPPLQLGESVPQTEDHFSAEQGGLPVAQSQSSIPDGEPLMQAQKKMMPIQELALTGKIGGS